MSKLIGEFVKGLNIPEKVSKNLFQKRDNEELKVFALNIPDLEYPDTYILAGRILIYVNIKLCPSKISDYVDILTDILHPNIKQFLLDNQEKIEEILEETYFENFSRQNILSASANLIYLLRISHNEPPVETPCMCKMRQAIQFYHKEGIDRVLKCYRELLENLYVHASPTMFNAGLIKGQMASCMLLNLGDNLENLLDSGAGDVGKLSKVQAGIGMSLNAIRHSNISNSGKSSGVMPFGEIYDKVIKCVNQGGKRNGAITLYLNDWHIDFLDFIRSRDNYTHNGVRFKTANISVFLTKLFMERVSKKGKWTMFCPAKAKIDGVKLLRKSGPDFEKLYLELEKEAPKRQQEFEEFNKEIKEMEKRINSEDSVEDKYIIEYHKKTKKRVLMKKNLIEYKQVDAFEIYKTICDMNVKSGMPYVSYRDASNLKNNTMNIGSTEGLNLCKEVTLPSSPDCISSCNLGHLNLKAFVRDKNSLPKTVITKENLKDFYDFQLMKKAIFSLVENINKVIDYNYYPFDERDPKDHLKVIKSGKISKPNLENRPIGIGVSGLAETFALLNIAFDSDIAKHLNKMIFAAMYYYGSVESNRLALKNGEYKTFRTGESKIFVKEEGWKTFKGSPLSNGYFQFDLWQAEAEYLKSIGRLQENIYKMEDNIPIEPTEWGEEGSWDSLREKIVKEGVYNSMLLAPMPTASSSQLVRNAECFEAHQALIYSRKLVHGNIITFSEPFVQDMIEAGLWNKKTIEFIELDNGSIRYLHHFVQDNPQYFEGEIDMEKIKHFQNIHRGMYEISQKDTMLMSRQRGIYICQSQSLNIYLPEPTKEQLMGVHMYSNALQLKTGMYYLRQNQASQTDRLTVNLEIKEYYEKLTQRLKTKIIKNKKVICTEEVCISCQ